MAYLDWNNSYSVKIAEIDDQHKHLIDYINQLHEAMSQGKAKDILENLIEKLANYASNHFTLEEKYMQQYQYPEFVSHKKAHDFFINQVLKYKQEYTAGKLLMSVEIMMFLKDWLVNHIIGIDQKYTNFFNEKGLK